MKRILVAGLAALALALTGACAGDDADVDADLSADVGDDESVQEYCEFAAELDSRQAEPSEEDLDKIVEVAPDEIKEDVETVVAAIRAGDPEAEGLEEADQRLQEWEEEHCDRTAGSEDGGDGGSDNSGPGSGGTGGPDDTDADGTNGPGGTNGTEGTDDDGTGAEIEAEVNDGDETTTTTH